MSEVDARRSIRRCALWALLLASGVASGCAELRMWDPDYLLPGKRKAMVREVAEAYGANLRWGRYEVAAGLVAPESRGEFLGTFMDAEPPYQFTSFEIVGVELGPERDRVVVLAVFHLYRPPSLVELSVTERQSWRYEPIESERWVIEPDLRPFRATAARVRSKLD